MLIKTLMKEYESYEGKTVCLQGWIRKSRFSKNVGFIELNDGSFFKPVQLVLNAESEAYEQASHFTNSSSIEVEGKLVKTPQAKQPFEIRVERIELLGLAAGDYPLQNKRQSFEFLRQLPSLRSRTSTFQAVFRTRSEIAFALHEFFHKNNFVYVHTPIITASDAEGAGEMFQATTLDLDHIERDEAGKVDYSKDFFGAEANLTVSGQLEVEAFAMSHRNVYTFGPTFRAEHSNTTRHAAEFWMVEPEIAFADLNDVMDLAEEVVKYVIEAVMDRLPEEMEFFDRFIQPGLLDRLRQVKDSEFRRMTYTEAVEILEKENSRFENPVHWGDDLQSEHERYLTEQVVKGPLFLTDYPKDIKAFYMRMNDDEKTVAACDMLVPGIGELIGASQREERADRLQARMQEKGMNVEDYRWYLNLDRFGGCKHGGFGIGFERLVMYMTGMENIRDVLPYPRTVNAFHKK